MPPDLAEVRRWFEKADRDRRMAEMGLQAVPPMPDVAAFHCQQAVEKLLKSYLVWRHVEFEKTHDLRALIELCAEHDQAFFEHRDEVESLTPYAIRFRYPGPPDPTTEEVRRALAVVEQVRSFVRDRLPAQTTP
jgi:HEPN domain-containing protein